MFCCRDYQLTTRTRFNFSLKQSFFSVVDKLLPGLQHGFLSLRKMLFLIISNTVGVWVKVCSSICYGHCAKRQPCCNGSCYGLCFILTGVSLELWGRCYCHHCTVVWCGRWKVTVMLFICVSNGKPLWQVLWPLVLSKWQVLLPMLQVE